MKLLTKSDRGKHLTIKIVEWLSTYINYFRIFFACLLYLAPAFIIFLVQQTGGLLWCWSLPKWLFIFGIMFDFVFPDDAILGLEKFKAKAIVPIFWLLPALCLWASIVICLDFVTSYTLSLSSTVGLAVSCGMICAIATSCVHELSHQKSLFLKFISVLMISPIFYAHFIIEHTENHHLLVGTKEDSASAKLHEGFWRFLLRSLIDSLHSSFVFENNKKNKSSSIFRVFKHRFILFHTLSVLIWMLLFSYFGIKSLLFLITQTVIGIIFIESVNYLQHYGLQRQFNQETQKYEDYSSLNTWDSNTVLSTLFIFNAGKHNEHHANENIKFYDLKSDSKGPMLPHGYPLMILLSFFPKIWFRVMDPMAKSYLKSRGTFANNTLQTDDYTKKQ